MFNKEIKLNVPFWWIFHNLNQFHFFIHLWSIYSIRFIQPIHYLQIILQVVFSDRLQTRFHLPEFLVFQSLSSKHWALSIYCLVLFFSFFSFSLNEKRGIGKWRQIYWFCLFIYWRRKQINKLVVFSKKFYNLKLYYFKPELYLVRLIWNLETLPMTKTD